MLTKTEINPSTCNKDEIELNSNDKLCTSGLNFYKLFWVFFIGSILGVVVETLWCLVRLNEYQTRVGVIYGPFNPVYGFGAVVLTVTLYKLRHKNVLLIFLGSMIIGGSFEYMCSLFQELAFGTVSWEYSNTPLNLDGRTNLKYAFFWGLLGLLWIKIMYPRMSSVIEKIPKKIGIYLTWILVVFMILNMTISVLAVTRQSQRRDGVPATNSISRFLDKHYHDEFLNEIYVNMTVVEKAKKQK